MDSFEETLTALRLLVQYQIAAALELGKVAYQFKTGTTPDLVRSNLATIERTQVLVEACLESLKSEGSLTYTQRHLLPNIASR